MEQAVKDEIPTWTYASTSTTDNEYSSNAIEA